MYQLVNQGLEPWLRSKTTVPKLFIFYVPHSSPPHYLHLHHHHHGIDQLNTISHHENPRSWDWNHHSDSTQKQKAFTLKQRRTEAPCSTQPPTYGGDCDLQRMCQELCGKHGWSRRGWLPGVPVFPHRYPLWPHFSQMRRLRLSPQLPPPWGRRTIISTTVPHTGYWVPTSSSPPTSATASIKTPEQQQPY